MAKRLTPEQRQLRLIKEDAWKATVVKEARERGWMVFFIPDRFHAAARLHGFMHITAMGDNGYPDLTLVGERSIIFAELKREVGNHLSDEQKAWGNEFNALGANGFVGVPAIYLTYFDDLMRDNNDR